MLLKKLIINITFLLIFSAVNLVGQIDSSNSNLDANEFDSVFVMTKSPTGAMLRSMVLPGWGQFYNESYWKIPVVWGVSAWFIYMWVDRNDNYKYYQNLYNISLTESSNGNSIYKSSRDFYRDDRDLFAVYLGLTYFLNFIDAYVDAHLFDFYIGENAFSHTPELRMKIRL